MVTTDINANKNAEVASGIPDGTYHSGWFDTSVITCSKGDVYEDQALIGFDISTVAGKTINSAKLYVYVSDAKTNSEVYIRRITDNTWTEGVDASSGVTWNTKPSYTNTNGVSFYGTSGWYFLDITTLFKDESGNDFSIYAIGIAGGSYHEFASRETTNIPYLHIDYDSGNDYYVKHQAGASNANPGTSWANAWRDIGYALQNCPTNKTLHIASNTGTEYTETVAPTIPGNKLLTVVVENENTTTRGKCQIKISP